MASAPRLDPGPIKVDHGDRPRRPDTSPMAPLGETLTKLRGLARDYQSQLAANPQRVMMRQKFVDHRQKNGPVALREMDQYIGRGSAQPTLFGAAGPAVGLPSLRPHFGGEAKPSAVLSDKQHQEWSRDTRHFGLIFAPESRMRDDQLVSMTRAAMSALAKAVGERLEWRAVAHHDTDHSHVHVMLRGRKMDSGQALYLDKEHLAKTREAAVAQATKSLGPAKDDRAKRREDERDEKRAPRAREGQGR